MYKSRVFSFNEENLIRDIANYERDTGKENNIKEVADEYKNIIPKKLYDALYAYKVDINNDKNYKVS